MKVMPSVPLLSVTTRPISSWTIAKDPSGNIKARLCRFPVIVVGSANNP
jgi:hypothetical protein